MIGSRTVGSSAAAAVYDPVALGLKENTVLEWTDMNSSPLERRAEDPKYSQVSEDTDMTDATTNAGAAAARSTRSRAKAQDFLD
ncbi:hypothetical protein FRB91_011335 [Serendipita sp. 411]|nr:hypothetical protein FRB91_011335 [Serendipita sp. 411]